MNNGSFLSKLDIFKLGPRVGRIKFFTMHIILVLLAFLSVSMAGIAWHPNFLFPVFPSIVLLLLLIVNYYSLLAKRLHDIDSSAWWILFMFIPVIGTILYIAIFFISGTKGNSQLRYALQRQSLLSTA